MRRTGGSGAVEAGQSCAAAGLRELALHIGADIGRYLASSVVTVLPGKVAEARAVGADGEEKQVCE
jgi:hypothetical protein